MSLFCVAALDKTLSHFFYNTQQLCTGPTTTDPKQSPFTSDNQAIFRRTELSS